MQLGRSFQRAFFSLPTPTHTPHPPNKRFPTSTNKDLAEKLYAAGVCQGSARFKRPKLSQTAFTIEHYAGGWLLFPTTPPRPSSPTVATPP